MHSLSYLSASLRAFEDFNGIDSLPQARLLYQLFLLVKHPLFIFEDLYILPKASLKAC